MSSTSASAKKHNLINNWPRPIARWTPTWIPYPVLKIAEWVVYSITTSAFMLFMIAHHFFGNTDLWGVRRDRAKERQWNLEWKVHRKEETYWKPPMLSTVRKRRLSLPLELKSSPWWKRERPQRTFDQQQSPLGRLPEELRLQIYCCLVAGQRLHLQESYQRFGLVGCEYNHYPEGPATCNQLYHCIESQLDKSHTKGDQYTGYRLTLSSYEHLRMKPMLAGSYTLLPKTETLALAKTCRLLPVSLIPLLHTSAHMM